MKQCVLGSLVQFVYGKGLSSRNRKPGSVPVYGSAGMIDTHDMALVRGPGIIVGRKGTVGSVHWTERDFYPIDTTYYVVPKCEDIRMRYIYYLLKILPLPQMNTDVAVPGLNRSNALRLMVTVPLLSVQDKIIEILSAYEYLIENNRRRIHLLEKSARLLYKEWFVHLRFPGHENTKIINGVPEGWERKHLSDLVTTQYGFTETATNEPIGPKFLRGTDINKTSYIDWSTVPFCPEEKLDFNKYALQVDDIVVIRMADPGKVAIIESEEKAIFASYLVRLTRKTDKIPSLYLFYVLSDNPYQGFISGASGGSTRKSASAKLLTNFNIVVPSLPLANLFVEKVYPLRQQIQNLLRQNTRIRKARDLILPRLMNGTVGFTNRSTYPPQIAK